MLKIVKLTNKSGIVVELINIGATIKSIKLPNEKGILENITLTHASDGDYLKNKGYFGSTVGRTSGRISNSKYILNGKEYVIEDARNGLHGGKEGFSFKEFEIFNESSSSVTFKYFSADLEGGYPGNLDVVVEYILNEDNQLLINYQGNSDQDTLLNLTNHSYFNLSGDACDLILDHQLVIEGSHKLEVDSRLLPTGELIPVDGTIYDFNQPKKIRSIFKGKSLSEDFLGLDDTWILDGKIILVNKNKKRRMTIETTYPAVVIYTLNFPSDQLLDNGSRTKMHHGICFECQFEPNGINIDKFNSAILRQNKTYKHQIKYTFEMGEQ